MSPDRITQVLWEGLKKCVKIVSNNASIVIRDAPRVIFT